MYCSNCGNKIDEKAVICIHCGCAVPKANTKTSTHGKGIASMVLGIIGMFWALAAFSNLADLDYLIYEESSSYITGYAIGTILIQSVFAIIAICLACSERKNAKNGFNTAGLWLSIAIFAIAAIQFISIITY